MPTAHSMIANLLTECLQRLQAARTMTHLIEKTEPGARASNAIDLAYRDVLTAQDALSGCYVEAAGIAAPRRPDRREVPRRKNRQ